MTERFRFLQGDFAACGRRVTLPAAAKSPKRRRGRLRMDTLCPYSPFPGPHYESYPLDECNPSGAQNLSGWSEFPPGHFVVADFVSLASPGPGKARSLHRSSSPTQTRYAGLCVGGRLRRPVGRKISNGAVQKLRLALTSQRYRPVPAVGAAFGRPRAGLGPAPTERPESFPYFVGAAHWAARERPDGGIGPYRRSNAPSDTP